MPTQFIHTHMPRPRRETILLVDDESSIRMLIRSVLEREGYRVIDAATGREAIDIFRRQSRNIDLLITDVSMPVISGPALVDRLVANGWRLPVLYISGFVDEDLARRVSSRVNLLAKPFPPATLLSRVKGLLDSPARAA